MKKIAMTLIFLCVGSSAFAEDSGLCEEAGKFTCAAGTYDDGTGVKTTGVDADRTTKMAKALEKEIPELKSRFTKLVANPDDAYFKTAALSSFGLNNSPDCQATDGDSQKRCSENLVANLVDTAKKQIEVTTNGTGTLNSSPYGTMGMTLDLSKVGYVVSNRAYTEVLATSTDRIASESSDKNALENVKNKMFPQIKNMLVKRISNLPIDEAKKKLMMDKIKNIRFDGNDCSKQASGLNEAYFPNASYWAADQTFSICKGFLTQNPSQFSLALVMAHELAHSIDPCNISIGAEGATIPYSSDNLEKMAEEYPVKGLISCLRSNKSVGALRDTGTGSTNGYGGGYGAGYGGLPPVGEVLAPKTPATETGSFCAKDQITESVADWFGSDVMNDYISANYPNLTQSQWQNGIGNVFRGFCVQSYPGVFDPHPRIEDRVNTLLLQSPQMRQKMGCTKPHSKYTYCNASNPDATALATDPEAAADPGRRRKKPTEHPLIKNAIEKGDR